jgi:hypothetical protein
MTAEADQECLRQQQPWPGANELGGQRPQPPVDRRTLAPQQEPVEVPLQQPGRPQGVAGGHRVPDGVVSQPVRF